MGLMDNPLQDVKYPFPDVIINAVNETIAKGFSAAELDLAIGIWNTLQVLQFGTELDERRCIDFIAANLHELFETGRQAERELQAARTS